MSLSPTVTPPPGVKRKRSQTPRSELSIASSSDIRSPAVGQQSSPSSPIAAAETRPLPLTTENLAHLPGSPPQKPESTSTMPPKNKTPSIPGYGDKWGEVLRIHAEHGMIFLQGSEALTLPPAVDQAVAMVMNTNSWNEMKTASAYKIIDKMAASGSSNELSVLVEFWMGLHKEKSFGSTGIEPIEKEWEDVGLVTKFDQQFCLRGPSVLNISNPEDKKILDAIPEVQHPQPDITFGLREKLGTREFFTEAERSANMILNQTTQITYDVFHSFAVWEQKKSKPIELAQVQALRGGSTLVWAFRHNQAQAAMLNLEDPGIDATNIAFSFAANTTLIRIFVHYAEVGEDKRTKFYMQEIREFSLNKKDQLKRLRSDLDHILDWGTLTRINCPGGTKEILSKIKKHRSTPQKAQKIHPTTTAGASSRASGGS